MHSHIRGVFKKVSRSLNFHGLRIVFSIFDFFVALCWYSCFSFMPTSTAILNVQLIFDSCFACTCFGSSSIFAYSKKWIKESVSNFVWKTKLSARTHSDDWLWHKVKLPWSEATFIGGTKCFPIDEKMSTTKSVPDTRALHQQTKIVLVNSRITVIEVAEDLNISIGSCHSIFTNDLGMTRVSAKFVPKLLNFDQKQHCINIAQKILDSVRTTQICARGS